MPQQPQALLLLLLLPLLLLVLPAEVAWRPAALLGGSSRGSQACAQTLPSQHGERGGAEQRAKRAEGVHSPSVPRWLSLSLSLSRSLSRSLSLSLSRSLSRSLSWTQSLTQSLTLSLSLSLTLSLSLSLAEAT